MSEPNSITAITEDTSYAADAQSELYTQFQGKPAFAVIVAGWTGESQTLEGVFWSLLTESLTGQFGTAAAGNSLDILGRVLGLQRGGLGDTTYRLALLCQILVLRSNGHPDDLIQLTRQFLPVAPGTTFTYTEWADPGDSVPLVAAANILVSALAGSTPLTTAQATLLATFLQAAAAVGVRVTLIFSTVNDLATFCFDDSTNPTQPASRGWGDSTNGSIGGAFASALD